MLIWVSWISAPHSIHCSKTSCSLLRSYKLGYTHFHTHQYIWECYFVHSVPNYSGLARSDKQIFIQCHTVYNYIWTTYQLLLTVMYIQFRWKSLRYLWSRQPWLTSKKRLCFHQQTYRVVDRQKWSLIHQRKSKTYQHSNEVGGITSTQRPSYNHPQIESPKWGLHKPWNPCDTLLPNYRYTLEVGHLPTQ